MTAKKARGTSRFGFVLAPLVGMMGAVYLIFHVGFAAVATVAVSVGWAGFSLLWLYGLANFFLLGIAWFLIVPPHCSRQPATFIWGRAVRDSAGELLPFSQFGGMAIGARATMLRGITQAAAFASTIVDVTLEMIAQIVFVIMGLVIVVLDIPEAAAQEPLIKPTIIGLLVAMLVGGALFVGQRRGFSFIERIAKRLLPAAAARAARVAEDVGRIHARLVPLVSAFFVHLLGWLFSAFGTWLALELVHSPVTFGGAIAIEGLMCAVRSAGVFVPGAIGIQEVGYAILMPLFGGTPEIGIAISLLKRARELATGIPILVSWQIAEGNRAFSRKGEFS